MLEFVVQDMSCGHCVSTITKTLKHLDPQAEVEVDLAEKTVRVESGRDRASLAQALADAGFPPS